MGFDISGVNPKMNKNDYPLLDKYDYSNFDSWDDRNDAMEKDNEKEKYWEQYEQSQIDNPGMYFRNNVWWWRPLWTFVSENCDDILTDEDIEHGCYNNNHEINEKKAKKIAERLYMLIEDKTVADYELAYEEYRKNKKESDDKKESFMGNYPFCQENIAKFAKFCEESGGFVIN